MADARARGDTIVPGEPPHVWAARLVTGGKVEPDVAGALVALALASRDPAAVSEAARLATRIAPEALSSLFPAAIDAQDTGVLLHADPFIPHHSVEDALLRAWAAVAPDDPAVRTPLLERLRNAGLSDVEVSLLARHGSPAEIRTALPLVFIEGVPADAAEALSPVLARDASVGEALSDVLRRLPTATRAEIVRRNPSLEASCR